MAVQHVYIRLKVVPNMADPFSLNEKLKKKKKQNKTKQKRSLDIIDASLCFVGSDRWKYND